MLVRLAAATVLGGLIGGAALGSAAGVLFACAFALVAKPAIAAPLTPVTHADFGY
jgi:hypothetical protein